MSAEHASVEFQTSLAEARQTLLLMENLELPEDCQILEVGAGMGIASTALSFFGFQVTSLEPGGVGFEQYRLASQHISKTIGTRITLIDEKAEDVKFTDGTVFELIISNNVLEHVENVEATITNLLRYLSPSGMMLHSCPNYTFPFEPHFGIPLIPFIPRFTSFFLPKSIRHSGLWKSLNFVTAFQLRRILRKSHYTVKFREGTLLQSINRLNNDSEFKKRHRILGRIASNSALLSLLNRLVSLPYWIATPMDFVVMHKSRVNEAVISNWLKT